MQTTDAILREIIKPLRRGDVLHVCVMLSRHSWKMEWRIDLVCSRSAWPSLYTRSRKTATLIVGHSHTKELATKRGEALLRKLIRLRDK